MSYKIIGPDDPALNVLRDELQRRPNWQAELIIIPWADYRNKLMAALESTQTPYQAVCVPGHIWIPELADAGYLAPFEPLLNALPADLLKNYAAADILPAVAAESRFQGRQYMLPLFTDGHILFYRRDALELAGGDDGTPLVSPLELGNLAAKAHNPPELYGLALKAHPSEIFLDWLPFLWAAGGEVLDQAGCPAFAGEAGISALEYYCNLRQFCPPDTHTYGNAEIAEVIKKGQAALVTTWGGQSAAIMLAEDNAFKEVYGSAVFPKPWNATWGVAIPANQTQATQAATLSILLQASGAEQDRMVTRAAGSPVRQSSYTPEALKRYHQWLPAQYKMLQRAGVLPVDPRTGAYLGILYEAVYAAFTGQASPAAALQKAADEVKAILKA